MTTIGPFLPNPKNLPPKGIPVVQSGTIPEPPKMSFVLDALHSSSVRGTQAPVLSLFEEQQEPPAAQLSRSLNSADRAVLDKYGLSYATASNGTIVAVYLAGNPVSSQEAHDLLVQFKDNIILDLNKVKQEISKQYAQFVTTSNAQFNQMSSSEQVSTQIQLQTINKLYVDFMKRLKEIGNLID